MATIKHPQTIIIQPGERITAREYAALPDEPGWKTELHQGVVVKMPLIKDMRHDWIVANLIAALHAFVMLNGWGASPPNRWDTMRPSLVRMTRRPLARMSPFCVPSAYPSLRLPWREGIMRPRLIW